MKHNVVLQAVDSPVTGYLQCSGDGVSLWWLGQAGFLIRQGSTNIVIDAYLSDFLAEKYRGQTYPHTRMMGPPISMDDLIQIDYCVSSHSHSDHMDPGLLPVLADRNPNCLFVVPAAAGAVAAERGVPEDRLMGVDAGDRISLGPGMSMTAIPSAHEAPETDGHGRHLYLGYMIELSGLVIYHSGDCVEYENYPGWLEPFTVDLALLPVNGRDEKRTRDGIAGNFTFSEACEIVRAHRMAYLIPHHIGMFEFNTLDPAALESAIARSGLSNRIFSPRTGLRYHLQRK